MKVLVIRFSSIGDIVLTSPVVRCVREQLGAEVHFLTKRPFRSLVEYNPDISRVYTIDSDIDEVLEELKREKYDLALDLHKNLRSRHLLLRLRRESVSFSKINFRKWLAVRFKWDVLPRKHLVDRYFDALQKLGVENDGLGLSFHLPEMIDEAWDKFLREHPGHGELEEVVRSGKFVVMPVGAAHRTKCMPVALAVEICKGIDMPVVLLSGPDFASEGREISRSVHHVWNLCGETTIPLSAFLIRQSVLVITPDTGMMHIAAAFRKKIVSVWGNTVPEFGMYPYYGKEEGSNEICQVDDLSCRPCSKIGYSACPKGHFRCMLDQEPDEIVRKGMGLIEK